MCSKRPVILVVYFVGAVFLVTGHSFKVEAVRRSDRPSFDGPNRDSVHVTVWTPPYKQFELLTLPADQSRPLRPGEGDDASVRPAWGILAVMVLFFLYLWTNAEHGDVIVIPYSDLLL